MARSIQEGLNNSIKTTYSGIDIQVVAYPSNHLQKAQAFGTAESQDFNVSSSESLVGFNPEFDPDFSPTPSVTEAQRQEMSNLSRSTFLANQDHEAFRVNNQKMINDAAMGSFVEENFFELGSLATISYSTFREKFGVRTLGRTEVKSYTRGPRTIAGTMVFTVFNTFELDRMIALYNQKFAMDINLLDQLPPFNIMLVFANEYGSISMMHLFDIDFNAEGQSQSINDLTISRSLNFYCKDMLPLKHIHQEWTSYSQMFLDESVQEKLRLLAKPSVSAEPILTFDQIIKNTSIEEINELRARNRRTTI